MLNCNSYAYDSGKFYETAFSCSIYIIGCVVKIILDRNIDKMEDVKTVEEELPEEKEQTDESQEEKATEDDIKQEKQAEEKE